MNFTKVQGAGNDFVLFEAEGSERNWGALAKAVCDRHFGVGADGMLLLLPSDRANYGMRIFNLDGSEADVCGNGLIMESAGVNRMEQSGLRMAAILTTILTMAISALMA